MPLRPGLLWLTLNLALITQCLSRNNIFVKFTCPVRYFRVPPWVRVPQVEYHWSIAVFARHQFLDPILIHFSPVHNLTSCFIPCLFPNCHLTLEFSNQNAANTRISGPCSRHPILFLWWLDERYKNTKLFVCVAPPSCYSSFLC
jgi:hypothetical protein